MHGHMQYTCNMCIPSAHRELVNYFIKACTSFFIGTKKKETKLGLSNSKADNFSDWYSELVVR